MGSVFLNGRFVHARKAKISVFDRGFLYGDGVFETLRLSGGDPLRWEQHLDRLLKGAAHLKIRVPYSSERLRAIALELARRNRARRAVLRIQLTRGPGPRGYAIGQAKHPTLVMSLHPAPPINVRSPPRWKLITATIQLPVGDSLSRFKTCNRLPYLLARVEAEAAGADDALLLNSRGEVVETSSANVFWTDGRTLITPPLVCGALPGITRAVVIKSARRLGIVVREQRAPRAALSQVRGMFLTLSTYGIVEVAKLDGRRLAGVDLLVPLREALGP